MKMLFGMALRQTTGFVKSLLRLIGLDWTVPDFSTLSRRQKTLPYISRLGRTIARSPAYTDGEKSLGEGHSSVRH